MGDCGIFEVVCFRIFFVECRSWQVKAHFITQNDSFKDRYGNSALHLAAAHTKLNMIQFLLYRGLTANCRNMHQQSPDMVVGDEESENKDHKRVKKIRRILTENGVLQKKLAQNYKEKLRAERKERESLESLSTRGKWDFTCEELLNSIEVQIDYRSSITDQKNQK